ncbi:uncharacterized protein LOC132760150 isoform X2 [Ruditapes philippinarum]|uniref:uncharacterized protein LOC132760150 isoform X2 n=1 Tax=Ruditapes philippinarum TaxID=129788 RepID=UPI00295C08DC|nr:uncharacterized protein LOC132760150 isoform X2 [Ruditapes philippinarum]
MSAAENDVKRMETRCNTCRKQMQVMKRCTRCKSVMYCSRDCQVKDWPKHQLVCNSANVGNLQQEKNKSYLRNDNSIFEDNHTSSGSHPPLVDFSKATKQKQDTKTVNSVTKPKEKCYLFVNEYYTDVPVVNCSEPTSSITVKCNKDKHKLVVQNTWTGVDIYKFLSHSLEIPLEKVKVIHKGKVLSRENICETIKDKAVYQVIGEVAENEEDLDQRDICVMMKQTGLDRQAAVHALKKKGDLLDALLDQ